MAAEILRSGRRREILGTLIDGLENQRLIRMAAGTLHYDLLRYFLVPKVD